MISPKDLAKVLIAIKNKFPEMTLNQLALFVMVAAEDGIPLPEAKSKLGLGDSSMTPVLFGLCEWKTTKVEGFNLICYTESAATRSSKDLSLSAGGRRLVDDLSAGG